MDKIIERLKEKVTIVSNSEYDYEISDTDEFISSVRTLIKEKQIVPVICEDMYEYEDPKTKERQSLHSYMVEKIIELINEKRYRIELTEEELDDIVYKGYYGISLLQKLMPKRYSEKFHKYIYKAVMDENTVREGICLKKEVCSFLHACNFPLIITTNCFPILEKELGNNYHSEWNEIASKNEKTLTVPCIYHTFGRASHSNPYWGYDEKQMFAYLRSVYSSVYAIKNLASTIASLNSRKTLLVLGNDSPDWLFRFILSPIYGGDVYDERIGFYINDETRKEEPSLRHFLENIHFEKESQLINVLNKLTEGFKEASPTNRVSHGKGHDFFVSYASEDREKVKIFVDWLEAEHSGVKLNIWYDQHPVDGIKDGPYWEKIIKEMKDSAYFIPFITENYLNKTHKFEKQQEELGKLKISVVSMTPDETLSIAKTLSGVQAELLLAQRWLEQNLQKSYSIPVVCANESFWGTTISEKTIEGLAESSFLPKSLFLGIEEYTFDVKNPHNFVLDWNRYKTIGEL